MGHDHTHKAGKNILLAFFLNAGFSIVEFIGGYLTNSVAIYSDALHDLGDSLALLFSYYAEKYSNKKPDNKFTFGYRRFSVLSALLNGTILFLGSLFVIYEAIKRFQSPEEVEPTGMLVLAILGIAVNAAAAFRLQKEEGINSKMVMYHLIEDILGWISVFIVSIVLIFKPWFILDSILSILISLIILKGVYKNVMKVFSILLQKFPDKLEIESIKREIETIDPISSVHAIKGWSLDSETHYLRFHVALPDETTIAHIETLRNNIKSILIEHNIEFSTIEFESQNSVHCTRD